MVRIIISEPTTKHWPRILQIMELNEYSKKEPDTHIAEFDILKKHILNELREVLQHVSSLGTSEQNNVTIYFDDHLISNNQFFKEMIECYAKRRLREERDPSPRCVQAYVRKPRRFFLIESYFQACWLLEDRLQYGDDPNEYINSVEDRATNSEVILCPNFNKSSWRSKLADYISLMDSKPDETRRDGSKGGGDPWDKMPL